MPNAPKSAELTRGAPPLAAGVTCAVCALGLAGLGSEIPAQIETALALMMLWCAAALGAAVLRRGDAATSLDGRWLFAAALLLRLFALALPPILSDDLYRYLWEGRVQLAGLNPFLHPPDDPALAPLRDEIWSAVNHRGVSTVYPPLALGLFQVVAAIFYAPMGWKLLSGAADLLVLGLLLQIVRGRGGRAWAPLLYALHPLPVLESAGMGHLESPALVGLMGAILLWDRGRFRLAVVAATGGALIKLLPAVAALPALRAAPRRVAPATIACALLAAASALPFADAGPHLARGFGRYYEAWAFNASTFHALEWLAGGPAGGRRLGVAVGALVCALGVWRLRDPARLALLVAGALLTLSPVVHPWYGLWALAPALAVGAWPWAIFASAALLSYAVLGTYDPATNSWMEPAWVPWIEYPPVWIALLVRWRRRERPWTPARPPRR